MSQQYDNTNQGILSRNTRKEADTHPDFRGELNCNGVDGWLSAYVKERKDGSGKFFSLRWKPKDEQAPAKAAPRGGYQPPPDADSDIPFASDRDISPAKTRRLGRAG
jgi:hypothetical protein